MPSADAWAGDTEPARDWTVTEDRSRETARLIDAKSYTITVIREGVGTLAAQKVFADLFGGAGEQQGPTSTPSIRSGLVIGYKGHPTILDTNLRRGDRFQADGVMWTVVETDPTTPGRLLANVEVRP